MTIRNELVREKTNNLEFRPGPTQTGLCSHRSWLEARNFGFKNKKDCTTRAAKTKALCSAPLFSPKHFVGFLMQWLKLFILSD